MLPSSGRQVETCLLVQKHASGNISFYYSNFRAFFWISYTSMRSPACRSSKLETPMPHSKPSSTSRASSLKRFKDDAREVLEGFECGIGVSNFDELVSGDRIEVFEIQKKARKLE